MIFAEEERDSRHEDGRGTRLGHRTDVLGRDMLKMIRAHGAERRRCAARPGVRQLLGVNL